MKATSEEFEKFKFDYWLYMNSSDWMYPIGENPMIKFEFIEKRRRIIKRRKKLNPNK